VAETWRPFHDALSLRPTASFIPDSYAVLENTGDLLSQFEEGNAIANNDNQTATTSPFDEDIIHSDLISDPVEASSEEEVTEGSEENNEEAGSSDIVPQIVDDGLDSNTRRSNRNRNPSKLLNLRILAARNLQEMANNLSDMELFTACQAES
jgi:hypothetical protein